jgi:hypothetical protein
MVTTPILDRGCITREGRNHHCEVTTLYAGGVPRPARAAPCTYSRDWPDVACDDPVAEVARLLAVRLRDALAGRSLREAGKLTGVDHTTIGDVLAGRVWPDIATIARLEAGLGADLWPGRLRAAQSETVGQ